MDIPAPRRPRRWSSACSGTLARLFVGVVLMALVAWPERYERVQIFAFIRPRAAADGSVVIIPFAAYAARQAVPEFSWRTGDDLRAFGFLHDCGDECDQSVEFTLTDEPPTVRGDVCHDAGESWYYRDAGLHVLLDIIRDAIDG